MEEIIRSKTLDLTFEEIEFLKKLLNQLTISPASPDSLKIVEAVRSIVTKLSA